MPAPNISFDTVRKIGSTLPDVVAATVYGAPALKVRGRMFACVAVHRSAEPHTLAIRLPFAQRDQLIAADPKTFYLTEHYADYPVVLLRLGLVRTGKLRELLKDSWAFMSAPDTRVAPRKRRSTRTPR